MRVSKALDDYIGQWSTMYLETCEATHVRGDQSAEVLDLRMSCLAENLDDVRALTNVLSAANADTNVRDRETLDRPTERLATVVM